MLILDGWGVAPDSDGNAITRANLPNYTKLLKNYPAMTLFASGNEVGLSYGEMGNSEVGHLNIGAGRVYYQTLPRIGTDIENGTFKSNNAFLQAVEHVKKNKSNLHLIGLIGSGDVHASNLHLYSLLELCKDNGLGKFVFVHAFLDGRDSVYNSGKYFVSELQKKMKQLRAGQLASLIGRYYAMDRDNHWDRIEKAYKLLTEGVGEQIGENAEELIESAYSHKIYDEEFPATYFTKKGKILGNIKDNDAVIFYNFRPDRARELTKAFILPGFNKFERKQLNNLFFVTMTEYEKELPVVVAYPPYVVKNSLAEVVSKAGKKQFHIAETEKYAHITFFLNGTLEDPFEGEDRLIVPSPKIASYDLAPEMSSMQITKEVVKVVEKNKYDLLLVNFACPDMVAHTGNLEATKRACEAVDKCLGEITEQVLARNGAVVVTGDHGNTEEVINLQTNEMDKEHSTNPVPLIVVANELMGTAGPSGDPPEGDLSLLQPVGMLADVAPTVLKLMGIEQPPEMTGQALV